MADIVEPIIGWCLLLLVPAALIGGLWATRTQWRRPRAHCPHGDLRGIYGDEINHTPGGRRLQCLDCGELLDGPVSLAATRRGPVDNSSSDRPD